VTYTNDGNRRERENPGRKREMEGCAQVQEEQRPQEEETMKREKSPEKRRGRATDTVFLYPLLEPTVRHSN